MRVFLAVLVLIFSLQSWTKADDIRDFEIEGISIGDNALDYFKKEKIDSNKSYYPNSKKFIMIDGSFDRTLQIYDEFYVTYQDNKKRISSWAIQGEWDNGEVENITALPSGVAHEVDEFLTELENAKG